MLNRANLRLKASRVDQAIVLYRRCLDLYREIERSDSVALAATNLGSALLEAGRVDEATESLQRALEAYQEAGSQAGEGTVSINLGSALPGQGGRRYWFCRCLNARKLLTARMSRVNMASTHATIVKTSAR